MSELHVAAEILAIVEHTKLEVLEARNAELLAALKAMVDAFELDDDLRRVPDEQCEAMDAAQTAIAKAEGVA
jgi:hypothetical protein